MILNAEEWLDNEDRQCRNDRLNRLEWIIGEYPTNIDISLFHGGLKPYYLFEEARYCFVYGQYLASIMLSLSYIETTLAGVFYASGRNDLQRARVIDLLKEAEKKGLISGSEFNVFNKVRKIRNPITHFRKPLSRGTLEYRLVKNNKHPYKLLERDAKIALKTTFRMMAKFAIPKHEDEAIT